MADCGQKVDAAFIVTLTLFNGTGFNGAGLRFRGHFAGSLCGL